MNNEIHDDVEKPETKKLIITNKLQTISNII